MHLLPRRRPNVQKLRRKGDLEGLRRALRYEQPVVSEDEEWDLAVPVRVEAAGALAEFYGPVVADALTEALADPYPDVRLAAVEGIERLGAPTAVEALVEACLEWEDDPDGDARRAALRTLAGWRLEFLPEVFGEKLVERDPELIVERHHEACMALLAADPRGPGAYDELAEKMIRELAEVDGAKPRERVASMVLTWLGTGATDRLLDALAHGCAKPAVATAAGATGDSRAVNTLVRLLNRDDAELRLAAAAGLGELSDSRAVPALLEATQDEALAVRRAASTALDRIGMAAVIVGVATLVSRSSEAQLEDGRREHASTTEADDGVAALVPLQQRSGGALEWAGEAVARLLGRADH